MSGPSTSGAPPETEEMYVQPWHALEVAIEPFMMIDPPSRISGRAFCTVNNVPRLFREKIVSNCSSLIVPNGKHHIH